MIDINKIDKLKQFLTSNPDVAALLTPQGVT